LVNAAPTPVPLQNATADFSQTNFGVAASIDGSTADANGWAVDNMEGASHTAVYETQNDVGFVGGTLFTFTLDQFLSRGSHEIGRLRLSITTDDRSTFADGLQTGGAVAANWIVLDPLTFVSSGGATLTKQPDKSILASGTTPTTDVYTVTAQTGLTGITGVRVEVLTDPSLPNNGPGRNPSNGNFVLTEFTVGVTAVPEPSSIALEIGVGIIFGARVIRRRILHA
jgi:hypothetical protein